VGNEILDRIAQDLKEIRRAIREARELIEFAKQAGEDVTDLEAQLRELEKRKARWERALEAQGYTLEE
jgi:predicted nuclease of restriction endonuclease-like RecB superfamily